MDVLENERLGEVHFEIVETAVAEPRIFVRDGEEADSYDIFVDGALFTTLHCNAKWAKPFMFPVLDAKGAKLTRAWPVIPDVPGETHDHPHQKSFWTAWGDMNGADGWGEDPKHGFATAPVRSVKILENGPLRVKIALDIRSCFYGLLRKKGHHDMRLAFQYAI